MAGAYNNRMAAIQPESREFKTPVYGTVFAERSPALGRLQVREALLLGTASWKRVIIVVTVHDLPPQRTETGHSDDLE